MSNKLAAQVAKLVLPAMLGAIGVWLAGNHPDVYAQFCAGR